MAYEQVPKVFFRAIKAPEDCLTCPSAKAVVSACMAALDAMKEAGYNEPPSHVKKTDKNCWVTATRDAQLRETDPAYNELVSAHDTALKQRADMKSHCPGGIIDRPHQGPALHNCRYVPAPGIPELPVPPGIVMLEPKIGNNGQ